MRGKATSNTAKTMGEYLIKSGAPDKVFNTLIDGLQAWKFRKRRVDGELIEEPVPDYQEQRKNKETLLKMSESNFFNLCSNEMKEKVRKVLSTFLIS